MINRQLVLSIAFLILGPILSAQVRNNDDSCDISVAPAATLLLPFFAVNLNAAPGAGETTVFTVTNVTRAPQIAHVTLWTDWAYPILTFNVFLTGYDVQTIDLFDVLVNGRIAQTSPLLPNPAGNRYTQPLPNNANPNLANDAVLIGGPCSQLPAQLPPEIMAGVRTALTTGVYTASCNADRVGGVHVLAQGYATIDVVNTCSANFPDNRDYLLKELLFDNALIGDYEQTDGDTTAGNFAGGNPMVHLRAVPEGGPAGSSPGTNLPYTFYDRYTITLAPARARTFDRRQPLPSVFAVRWIESSGTTGFRTNFKIWREGVTAGTQTCSAAASNSTMQADVPIRFDERENSFGSLCSVIPEVPCPRSSFPAASSVSTTNRNVIPPNGSNIDDAGWMYLNLDNGGSSSYSANGYSGATPFAPNTRASQNWVIVSMSAQGRYAVDLDAAYLGNGCSPMHETATRIGPLDNTNPSGFIPTPP